MTSHSYYKDRLGFDPNEQQPGSSNSMKRSSSRQTTHHHQSYHHATTSSSQSPARISVSPGGAGLPPNNGTLEYQQVQREQRDRELYSNSHNSHHHHQQQHHHRHSATGSASSPLYETSNSPAAPKKAKHSSTQAQPQGGYEDALTQFKGSMSIWDHFIEDWDIMHERDAIQKKTFTKWVNKHLKKHWKYAKTYTMLHVCVTTNGIPCCSQSANRRVVDLFEDLRDGHNLLSLLEVLSGEHLPREKGKMRFHMLQNAQMALDFLRYKKIKLVNIRAEDIVDGNPKLTLGLIWTIILHFQISDIVVGKEDNVSAREALLRWARRSTARYPGVRVNDFTSSWRDGLAFSALVHRNRPDLLDWRKARNDRPRDRLETAFHIVEKEYGVTRLLDPEDVDTNEPDEKSLITYISSLYDVFPEPPSIHPLFDMESQRRVHEYRDLAQQFIYWCREKTAYLQERSFPPTLIEMKRLLSDLQRFRSEEVSARKREKSKLIQIYKELERYFETVGEVDVEAELRPDAIEKAWYRMNTALQDREVILQQEIERLERLQRLADKVQREIKHVDQKLTDLETRIGEEGRRIERLHPVDAKSIVEALETEIRHLEEPIQDMNQDCHVLNEGRYPHVSELHKKVNKLHQRWAQLRTNFHTNLVQKLSGLKYPVHETTVTRQTRMVVESRQIDTNPHFRDLQEHIEWCQNKLKQLLAADYGSDLPSVKEELDRQQHEHKIIDQFHTKILNDERQQTKFSGDELALYQQRLNQLQKVYAELLSTSTKRLSDLDSLQHFLGQASAELQWLNEKEQVEITRDWADKQLDLPSVHRYYENLMSELEKREMHFATILDRGEALLNQQHPASKCIEAHLTALQQQWAWLLQLTLCLEVHLKHATEYHQFFGEIKDAEQWLAKRDEILNSKFSQSDFGLDQGETLLRGMQDLREELNAFGETVATLQRRAQTVVPLNKRRQPVNRQGPVQAICAYKQQGQLQIEKGETVTLLDNSGRVKWRVRTAKGQEGPIPGACLLLPPPDQEAIDAAERLKRLFDRSVALWQKKHLRLRQNMIFATIRVVKGWDFDQFLAMGPEQRTAIRRALNDDADKLLSEGDPNDPQLRRLRREMDEVNRLFDEFEKRARAEEESKQASRIFTEECIAIKSKLEDMARELDQIILAPLPRDLDSLEHVLEIHSDYERRLNLLEPELKHLQETFRTIALKTPVLKKSLDNLMELWKELNTQSGLHKDRLKLLDASLAGLEDNEHVISELENELARHQDLPSTAEGLQQVFKQLNHMQDIITQQQPQMDKMNDAADQLGRMGVPTKVLGDLKRLHSNVERLNTRWSAVCNQLGERMRSCETAIGLMKNLQSSVQVEESWVDGTTERLSAMPTATSAYELDKLLGAAIERKPKIENVNVAGGRLIREAKIYDSKCLRFVDWLLEARPSFSPPRRDLRPADSDPGATQYYSQRLDNLNTKYDRLLEQLSQRLKTAIEVNGSDGLQYAESLQKPLKTFRVDFSAGSVPTGDGYAARQEDLYTTTYSTTQFSSTKTTKSSTKSVYSSDGLDAANQEGSTTNLPQSQIQFNEIRTLKRSQQLGSHSVLDIAGIRDPRTGRVLTIGEAIQLRILDVRTGEMLVADRRITLEQAADQGLIDAQLAGQLLQPGAGRDTTGRELSLLEVIQREISEAESGYETAEKRIKQAVFEKFNMCEENVNDLLKWVTTVEQKISSVGGPREKIDELRNQINALKQIKDEIESQQRPVATCLEQIRQIVLTGGDVLSAPEVTTLENSGRELRSRVDRVNDRTVRLLRRLEAGRDELTKLRSELDVFSDWLQVARRTLEDKERSLSDLTRLPSQADSVREFVSDVIGHQADLRFITMAAQKFVDESKEFLAILNDFRTSLPERLPHVEPLSSAESPIRQEVSLVSAQYKDLLNRVNALQDRVSGLGGRQREYQDALDKANEWLRSVHPRVSRIISEPIAGDPKAVQDQMNDAKALHNELLSSGRLVDNAQQALDNLLRSLGGQLSPMEINQLELPIADLKNNYQQLLDNLGEHCKTLDKTLVQSQGVQDALDSLVGWVNQAEDKYKLNLRPASLIKERLQEQIREHKVLLADLQSHQASIDSVQISAKHLLASASNARIAKKVESNLNDVTVKFEKLYEKANKRGEFLDDVYNRLSRYLDEISTVEQRMASLQEGLDSRETSLLPTEELARRMHELSRDKDQLAPQFEDCVRNGKELISLRDVTDTGVLRDRIKALESQWRNINISIDERAKLSKQKAEQQLAYEGLKDQVLSWLASTEARVNGLPPVAIDLERIKQQHDELKPICKDYRDYAPTIDKINDIGAQYDALIRPESPARKRSTYSPIKRASPLRRMSGDARSPSPTKGGILSPLSTGSSGFGSRRSSQDGFQLSELSPVQQQLSEINNRYGLIGVRLNDRQHELDNLNEELRKQYENLKGLAQFLERIQRQLPKESVSNKDEAERCIKQARKILEDMYEKQSLLDTTKAQVKDILRRKSDVPGAEQLRQENDSIQEKWKNLNDICKNRIAFSEKLRDFLDTHGNLKSWLDSKERMLTVLGPISSDPRMVQSQVQQVQVLREEFRTQQPQLKHFQELGHDVVDHLAGTPDAQAVELKLKDILGKWEDLVGKLDDRANSLGGAADSSKEFDAAVNRLREALQNISDNLDALPTDGDHQENLRKIENLERQLEGQRPLLADVEQSAATLCNILGDPASRADVNSRVAALEKQYLALQKKLDTKKAETEASLRDGRHFAENCSKTLGWLGGELSNLTDRLLVSAHKPTLQHQIDTHEPIYREVMAREHEVIMLINKGKDISDRQQDRGVKRDLDRIQQQWEKLRREAVDRHTRLQTCMEHCKKYSQTSETFLAWLRTAEDKLTDLTPGVLSKAKLETRLRDLQTFRSEVWKHSGEFENTKGLGETFLTSCDIDKEPIKAELQDIRDRWERLNNDLIARAHEIENCSRRLGDFNDELRNLDHSLGRCEDRLAAHDALGGAAKDPKLLERVKAIREELTNLSKPLQSLKALAKDISAEARAAGGDADHLTSEVDGLADRLAELQGRLDDRCGELQSAATAVSQFNEQMKSLGIDLNDLETEIEKLSPPAREIKIVQVQIDDVGKIQNKLDRLVGRLEDAERAADVLVDAGFAADTTQTREQISTLRKTLGRLDNRLRDHEENLQATLKALREFYDNQSQTLDDIQDVSDEFKRMKPVGSELDQIRRQQEDFRNFRERKVEPLAINVDKVNVAGRDLVRSAGSGVSTSTIEKDLEKLNDRWNDLKERMNERDRRLDVALLQSGKFQEALAGLSKWLSDTEEMVANQKPPSSDYKVVKAQLQEQKFLKKMLLDRQNSMGSLANLGKEVANHCEPAERASIEKQLNDLMKRFDALTDGAEQRELDLEEAMEVAKRFHDKISPLELWLDNTERSVKAMELIPTDEEKIQQRIREHDRLHDEILGKKPDFTDLADVAAQLMHLVSDEEAVNLGEKVRGVTERYTGLVDASDNIGALLAESRQGLRHLVLSYQDLVAWMESMEAELKRFKSVPVYAEKLLEQMDHLLELNENIAGHASNVESTVESGAELMKHISNDEAIQLKDKLDSLQRRYGDLTNRGGDLLKSAQNALPLVQQFHEAHNRLVEWMQSAEVALAPSEPRQADVLRLEGELADMRPILDSVNQVGPQLCQLSPGEGAATIESIVTRDNRRFDSIVEQIQRKAERLHLSNQRAKEVTGDIDELLEWFREMDTTLREADLPAMEPKLVRAQLQEHRSINDDISSQKGRVRDVTASSKKVLRESPQSENTATLREKLDDLKEIVDTVAQLCSERLGVLEQALPLSEHFADSHQGLTAWLDDMEQQISRLSMPALRPDQITLQQDKNERLLQSIAEHKPLLDKLNKTGEALGALVADDDSAKINEILDTDNARYAALRLELRERQQALESALQESSQFSDKLEGMLRALANTVDQVNQLDPLSALPQKIREQIEDNDALMDDLDKRQDAFSAVQRAANDVIAKAGNKSDPAVRDIKAKLEKLNNLWNDVQNATKKRGSSLDDILSVAEPFWKQLNSVMKTLKDLEETLSCQEPPAAQPQDIKKQQVALQEIRHEIDQTKPEVEQVRRHGSNLMNMCGEPDKPEVKKHIEDLDNAWDNITALYAKREENLIDAMEKAMEFHETLQNLLKFLTKAEDKFAHLGAVGSDIDAVKRQIEQLKSFKDEVDPHMVEVEALNRVLKRQAVELTERTSPEQAASIREPLSVVNRRWEALLRGMVERQKQLEHALLHLGQFQHALNELLVWINKTDGTLDQLKPIPGDPQLLEVELAKLKVLANDIQAHQNSVDTLNDAGRQLIETEKGSVEASTTQEKLRKLNNEWKQLLQKASDRQHELEEALREAHGYIAEVQDILGWLGDVDAVIGASKPVGGLPETATEQLERFMEVYNELDENRPKVETIQAQGQEYIKRQNQMKVSSSNLQHTLRTLKQRWDAVVSRASDKKIKLEIALKEATEFHDTLQAFVEWLTQAEKLLSNAEPVSRVLETIQAQMEEHKVLQKDVSTHREAMLLLDKKGTHLKYFSQKQDVILIKNLLVSVQHRWERVVSKAAERTRALDHGYKEAREFNDAWSGMMQYLQETEQVLDQIIEEATASKEPQKIKKYIGKLKETHRQLGAKQSVYDATMRTGKNLLERAPKGDRPVLDKMLLELKEQWTRVWSKSIDRQRKLEEALLLSGQFSDALGELLEWLKKAKSRLNENGPVHGDLETVQGLCEHHKHIEQDLQKRAAQMQGVLKTGRDLERSGNNPEVGRQLDEMQSIWEEVKSAVANRGERLQVALVDAEKLNARVQALFDWLDHAEHKLRYAKNAPDDEKVSREMMDIHMEFMKDLRVREREKTETFEYAEDIINKAYPDAIPIIKNWLSIIQQRWEEVRQWAINRESKLEQHLQSLKDLDDTIEELLAWLSGLEGTLLNLKHEQLPDEIPPVEKLIEDHKEFMENTARRQNEVDRACKPRQLPPGARKPSRSGKTPIRGSSHDLREQSPDGTLRRQSFKGSRDQGLNARKGSRITPTRDTPDRDRLPHYGPRFSPSTSGPELEFRSPRAKLLWTKWRDVWMLSWERQRLLNDHLLYLKDVERARNFSWDDWRKRFLKYMNHKKSRLTDLFRKMDKDNNGMIPRDVFIDGILNTKFDTSGLEMKAVADLFDRNGEGLIDWQEFIAALRPDWQERKPANDSDKIHDEVKRLVMLCTCRQKFRVFQVGEGKYRFGDSQKLRLVRILRSTVMVRVGGGWVALDEFLQKNDPCRAKGRTNIELREQFILADGVSQSMAAFTPRRSTPNAAATASSSPNAQNGGSSNLPPYMSGQGPIIKVRERSVRSIPMSRPSRSSLSASTPDSLSDNEGSHGGPSGRYTPRKVTYTSTRTGLTPGGSRAGSKPNSRPLSRQGSKPPSRHGSTLSLDSTDDHTPSRIPQRKPSTASTASGTTPRPARLSVTTTATPGSRLNGTSTITRKTASGSASPAPTSNGGMSRSSSIPALTGFGFKPISRPSRIPIKIPSFDSKSTSPSSTTNPTSLGRNISGSSTPSGMQTPRKSSAEPTFSSTMRRTSRGTTPTEKREPFRL
ncbi:microtubule-actin cross-linking factor 1 isoform X22 [Drosophila suzukii]|uniref:Microtubule-actin cross-linking factor 1 isoform X22 n=1 Tax=Drosophila suzukii TaxID=28584 RepID=A0ABM4TM11_DROSZ